MDDNSAKPFRADHVGSLLRPDRLLKAREHRAQNQISADQLHEIENECIQEVADTQEAIGLKVATDGEFLRAWWHLDFFGQIEGVSITEGQVNPRFRRGSGSVGLKTHSIAINRPLSRSRPIQLDDFRYLKSVAGVTPKVTLPSPSWLFIRTGRANVSEEIYPDLEKLADDLASVYIEEIAGLAAAGCIYLQLDETNFATLCDEKIRADLRSRGRDPDALLRSGTALMNAVIAAAPDSLTICTHACRGNFRSAWVAEGGYEPTAELLFNELNVDGYFLEFDNERSGGFEPLRFVPKGKRVVLGLVTSKRKDLEARDDLIRRIEEAAKYVPLDQLCLSPQCGFSSAEHGNDLSIDDQFAKLELIVKVADAVWEQG